MTVRHPPRLSLALLLACSASLQAQESDRAKLIASVDSISQASIAAGRAAGLSVAVVQGSDTIRLTGYGYADLELDAPTPDRALYEIGSVTKQFTAAAVYQLQEQGKLSLDDDITRFLPDYPTQGHRIPIRRLLNHTSGIKGYTEIPAFWTTIAMRAMPRDSLVAMFASQPFDFPPNDGMIYNNSAYFLLGLIIEKASGQPYEQYVEDRLFKPAGMHDSRYCSDNAIVKRRAKGYELGPAPGGGAALRRAAYLVHVWPYAAGSLCSTVRDLAIWTRALHGTGQGGTILRRDSYQGFITPDTLNNGHRLRYAHGLSITEAGGRRMISHGGGIYGFVSELRYYPDQDLTIAVLINTAGGASPTRIADAIADLVLGKPAEPPRAATFTGDLRPFVGSYQGAGRGRELAVTVSLESGSLALKLPQGEPRRLAYVESLTFASGTTRYHFVRTGAEVTELRVDEVAGYYVLRRDRR